MKTTEESGTATAAGPIPPRQIRIVRREEIPTLRAVTIDGVDHNLGVLKDFRSHPELKQFLPEDARLAMSWVHLEPSEALEAHAHPIDSMIVVGRGEGRTTGDLEEAFFEGDIILLPSGCLHGFVGAGAAGLWALSIQFEQRGLYEDPHAALVQFGADGEPLGGREEPSYDLLVERNRQYCEDHRQNPLFTLVQSGRLDERQRRSRFLDAVQVWSTWFQRALLARSAFSEDPKLSPLFQRHLDDEYGHNAKLAADRGGRPGLWDPVLEAASTWFAWKMLSLDNLEKVVLIHLVLESAGATFHSVAEPIMDSYRETGYFALHTEADSDHASIAQTELQGHSGETYRRLMRVQQEGWDMFNTLCARMAALADQNLARG